MVAPTKVNRESGWAFSILKSRQRRRPRMIGLARCLSVMREFPVCPAADRCHRVSSKQKFPRQISSGHVLNRVREACFAETFQAQLAGIAYAASETFRRWI